MKLREYLLNEERLTSREKRALLNLVQNPYDTIKIGGYTVKAANNKITVPAEADEVIMNLVDALDDQGKKYKHLNKKNEVVLVIEGSQNPRTILGQIKLPEDEVMAFWGALGELEDKELGHHIEFMDLLKRRSIYVTPIILKAIKKALKMHTINVVPIYKKVLNKVLGTVK